MCRDAERAGQCLWVGGSLRQGWEDRKRDVRGNDRHEVDELVGRVVDAERLIATDRLDDEHIHAKEEAHQQRIHKQGPARPRQPTSVRPRHAPNRGDAFRTRERSHEQRSGDRRGQ
jgi:hypothetical protein